MVIVERCILCGNWPATGDFCQQCVTMAALAIYIEPANLSESHGTSSGIEAIGPSREGHGDPGMDRKPGKPILPSFDWVIGPWDDRDWTGLDRYRK